MKYEYYTILCTKGDERVEFKVRGTSHTQYIWNVTHIDGLAKSAEEKIKSYKDAGYQVYAYVGDNCARVDN